MSWTAGPADAAGMLLDAAASRRTCCVTSLLAAGKAFVTAAMWLSTGVASRRSEAASPAKTRSKAAVSAAAAAFPTPRSDAAMRAARATRRRSWGPPASARVRQSLASTVWRKLSSPKLRSHSTTRLWAQRPLRLCASSSCAARRSSEARASAASLSPASSGSASARRSTSAKVLAREIGASKSRGLVLGGAKGAKAWRQSGQLRFWRRRQQKRQRL
mmetsp:Transcript_15384/g.44059  ORF Transcript_15384/g.44059 Transcript_15384/m.44059 type:complete len:217 (+) Transcript_15384:500-1150(+)